MSQTIVPSPCTGASLIITIGHLDDLLYPVTRVCLDRPGLGREEVDRELIGNHWARPKSRPDCQLHLLDTIRFELEIGELETLVAARMGIRRAIAFLWTMTGTANNTSGAKMPTVIFEFLPPHDSLRPEYAWLISQSARTILQRIRTCRGCDTCPLSILLCAAWELFQICPVSIQADESLTRIIKSSRTFGGFWTWERDTQRGRVFLDWRRLRHQHRLWSLCDDVILDSERSDAAARLRSIRDCGASAELFNLINEVAFEDDRDCLIKCLKARICYGFMLMAYDHKDENCDSTCTPTRECVRDQGDLGIDAWLSNEQADKLVSFDDQGEWKFTDAGKRMPHYSCGRQSCWGEEQWEVSSACSSCGR